MRPSQEPEDPTASQLSMLNALDKELSEKPSQDEAGSLREELDEAGLLDKANAVDRRRAEFRIKLAVADG
eukprot:2522777-Alexandrium_andersonii.AAC.1